MFEIYLHILNFGHFWYIKNLFQREVKYIINILILCDKY